MTNVGLLAKINCNLALSPHTLYFTPSWARRWILTSHPAVNRIKLYIANKGNLVKIHIIALSVPSFKNISVFVHLYTNVLIVTPEMFQSLKFLALNRTKVSATQDFPKFKHLYRKKNIWCMTVLFQSLKFLELDRTNVSITQDFPLNTSIDRKIFGAWRFCSRV